MGAAADRRGGRVRIGKLEAASAAFIALAALLVAGFAVCGPFAVEGPSMGPGLEPGDSVWLFRLAYGLRAGGAYAIRWAEPARGDIVVVRSPADGRLAVKRVAGAAGDPLAVSGNEIVLPGARAPLTSAQAFHLMGLGAVPEGEVFLLGDDPGFSEDSREYGCVPVAAVLGKVVGSIRRR
jgi:signal peptidase I